MMTRTFLSALSVTTLLLIGSAHAATKSISGEVFKEIDGQRFWQAEIECDNSPEKHFIQKDVNAEQWCLSASLTSCFDTKSLAAQKACSSDNQQSSTDAPIPAAPIAAEQPVESPANETANASQENEAAELELEIPDEQENTYDYDALRQEKNELEAERIQIQQEKLSLKRREIELQKQGLQLNNN